MNLASKTRGFFAQTSIRLANDHGKRLRSKNPPCCCGEENRQLLLRVTCFAVVVLAASCLIVDAKAPAAAPATGAIGTGSAGASGAKKTTSKVSGPVGKTVAKPGTGKPGFQAAGSGGNTASGDASLDATLEALAEREVELEAIESDHYTLLMDGLPPTEDELTARAEDDDDIYNTVRRVPEVDTVFRRTPSLMDTTPPKLLEPASWNLNALFAAFALSVFPLGFYLLEMMLLQPSKGRRIGKVEKEEGGRTLTRLVDEDEVMGTSQSIGFNGEEQAAPVSQQEEPTDAFYKNMLGIQQSGDGLDEFFA